ncbi:hypothetical protein [Streptomyces xiamenensis]|uniref:hypothetical protein n=1 Tax=Streptomyces xiamenensis TaxID=408015 RepID=UPI0037D3C466
MSPDAETSYDTPKRFRAPNEEWESFEDATKAVHPEGRGARAKVLREFMRWYMRRPGAKLPERPTTGPWSSPQKDEDAKGTSR